MNGYINAISSPLLYLLAMLFLNFYKRKLPDNDRLILKKVINNLYYLIPLTFIPFLDQHLETIKSKHGMINIAVSILLLLMAVTFYIYQTRYIKNNLGQGMKLISTYSSKQFTFKRLAIVFGAVQPSFKAMLYAIYFYFFSYFLFFFTLNFLQKWD